MTPDSQSTPYGISVFDYTDYRPFLADYLKKIRRTKAHFSYRYIADRLGLRSSGFFLYVIQGKRRLSEELALRIARLFKLNKKETDFFILLIKYTHTKSVLEKQFYFDRLASLRRVAVRTIEPQQHQFYEKWYYLAAREYVAIHPFTDQYEELARDLMPPITPGQAQEAIQTLARLGLIRTNDLGFYERTDTLTTTGDTWQSATIHNLQQQLLDLSKDALAQLPKEKRDFSNLTLSMSRDTFAEAKKRIEQLRAELLELARRDPAPSGIYQVNVQTFPLHETVAKDGNS